MPGENLLKTRRSYPIHFREFTLERLHKRAVVRRLPRHLFDERGGGVARPLAVDRRAQPVEQAAKVPFGEGGVEVAKVGAGPGE